MHHVRFQPLCIPLTVRSHLRSSVHLTYKIDGGRLATASNGEIRLLGSRVGHLKRSDALIK